MNKFAMYKSTAILSLTILAPSATLAAQLEGELAKAISEGAVKIERASTVCFSSDFSELIKQINRSETHKGNAILELSGSEVLLLDSDKLEMIIAGTGETITSLDRL